MFGPFARGRYVGMFDDGVWFLVMLFLNKDGLVGGKKDVSLVDIVSYIMWLELD